MIKRLSLTLLLAATIMAATSLIVVAGSDVNSEFCSGTGANTEFCAEVNNTNADAGDNTLLGDDGIITQVAQLLVMLTAAVSVVMVIAAGLMFIVGGGSPDTVSRARRTVLYAMAGLVIAMTGQLIVVFVLNQL